MSRQISFAFRCIVTQFTLEWPLISMNLSMFSQFTFLCSRVITQTTLVRSLNRVSSQVPKQPSIISTGIVTLSALKGFQLGMFPHVTNKMVATTSFVVALRTAFPVSVSSYMDVEIAFAFTPVITLIASERFFRAGAQHPLLWMSSHPSFENMVFKKDSKCTMIK